MKNSDSQFLKGTRGLYIGAMEKNREGGLETRQFVEDSLYPLGITVWNHYKSPISSIVDEGDDNVFKQMLQWKEDGNFEAIHNTGKLIRNNDLALIDKCDFVICELDMERLSCGTWEEFFLANRHKKKMFIYCEQGKKSIPLWVWWTVKPSCVYNDLDEILNTIKNIDSGHIHIDASEWKLLKCEFR